MDDLQEIKKTGSKSINYSQRGDTMCIANAYLIRQGKVELIMENVESVQAVETNVWDLSGLFGEDKRIKAHMKRLELLDNQLYFEEVT